MNEKIPTTTAVANAPPKKRVLGILVGRFKNQVMHSMFQMPCGESDSKAAQNV
jgi:hypothetical protein